MSIVEQMDSAFRCERLQELAGGHAEAYQTATPFPHIYLDNVFPDAILDAIVGEFPGPGDVDWIRFDDHNQVKLASNDDRHLGLTTRAFLHHLNGSAFLRFLETLTKIDDLVGDAHLAGGGMHQIQRGGKLDVHIDFNQHETLGLERRVNVLVFLNREWDESYGGHLEFWDPTVTTCHQKILPVFNRMAVFSTSEISQHGHPEPLTCPPDRTRQSIAAYYYTSTIRAVTGAQDDYHNTLFRKRPGEKEPQGTRGLLRRFVPPILLDAKNVLLRPGKSATDSGDD